MVGLRADGQASGAGGGLDDEYEHRAQYRHHDERPGRPYEERDPRRNLGRANDDHEQAELERLLDVLGRDATTSQPGSDCQRRRRVTSPFSPRGAGRNGS